MKSSHEQMKLGLSGNERVKRSEQEIRDSIREKRRTGESLDAEELRLMRQDIEDAARDRGRDHAP